MAIKLVVKLSVAQRGFAINGYSHIIIDEDGVGGGVVDQMQGVMAKNPIAAPSHELRRYLLDRVLDYFQRRGLDGLAGWFGREFHRLLSKGIDAAASFRSWFIDHRHFDESRVSSL
jgi:hypothetical protein